MLLRRSRFIHQLPIGPDRILIVHAISHVRFPADHEVDTLLNYFSESRRVPEDCQELAKLIPYSEDAIADAIKGLLERQILTEQTPEEELNAVSAKLTPTHGRDPGEILERYRRELKEGVASYWSMGAPQRIKDLSDAPKHRVDVLLFGDCDIQMEADFLRQEAARRGIDLHVAATFPNDVRFASDHAHDAIFIGALRARHLMTDDAAQNPGDTYLSQAKHLLLQLREKSSAPILIDNLPEPTVQPMGFAEQGLSGHRTRFRKTNVALSEMAAAIVSTYVVDIAAALAAAGSTSMVDDGLVGFTHFGAPGWLLQRPEHEKTAVHNIFPDLAPLSASLGGDPYGRERALAVTHIDALTVVLGWGRKKCIILDLDGTLWPGVLAETGSPFAWTPEISGPFSYIGLYFGLHEALLCLKKRGIVLACVSKNDETTVRELWKYPDNYPNNRLLTVDDFVSLRLNWNDKVDNIRSIAEELGFALDSFLFIDDNPVERDRVRQRLPEVEVWGEDPFSLRRLLLNDPRFQLPVITEEAATRSTLVKAQIERQHLRHEIVDEAHYLRSLNIQTKIMRLVEKSPKLQRIEELFQRTTQFNTTGAKFSESDLISLINNPGASVLTLEVSDRFGDHGLVGAAVIRGGDILGLVMSCRVLGLGIEHTFLQYILADTKKNTSTLNGKIIETSRNIPVRNIYRDNGFVEIEKGLWRYEAGP